MNILQDYYHLNVDQTKSYFTIQNKYYYFMSIKNIKEFEYIYQVYIYYMNLCHLKPYQIITNKNKQIHTFKHILFTYQPQNININQYLHHFIRPIQQVIYIKDIKEQWIKKSDELRKHITYNSTTPFIYYYTGLIEYTITLLNKILNEYPNAYIPLSLSLKRTISNTCQLLNPLNYIISSRIRHIALLLKSEIIDAYMLESYINQNIFSNEELYYLLACILYPHDIDIHVLKTYSYDCFIKNMYKVINIYNILSKMLCNRLSIVEISWLNLENMI